MDTLKYLLEPEVQNIENSQNKMTALSNEIYRISKDLLEDIMNSKKIKYDTKIVILGGIIINCEKDGTDMFLPKFFELRTGFKKVNLLDECFPNEKNLFSKLDLEKFGDKIIKINVISAGFQAGNEAII